VFPQLRRQNLSGAGAQVRPFSTCTHMSRLNRRITSAHQMRSAIVSILFITVIPVPCAPAPNRGITTEDVELLAEIRDHNELMANAEHLSDVIGPRLTGSAAQRSASDWAEQRFQKYGLVNITSGGVDDLSFVDSRIRRSQHRLAHYAPACGRLGRVVSGHRWRGARDGRPRRSRIGRRPRSISGQARWGDRRT
jgi:hypothetical protein